MRKRSLDTYQTCICICNYHHPVPCFIALAIMSFHIPRSLVAFRISTTLPAPSHLTSPSVIFSRCFPLLRFPSIIPVVMRCSNFSLLITWPKNVVCRVRILFTSALDVWVSFSTVSFDFFAIHDIFIVLLRNHISTVSSLISVTSLIKNIWKLAFPLLGYHYGIGQTYAKLQIGLPLWHRSDLCQTADDISL